MHEYTTAVDYTRWAIACTAVVSYTTALRRTAVLLMYPTATVCSCPHHVAVISFCDPDRHTINVHQDIAHSTRYRVSHMIRYSVLLLQESTHIFTRQSISAEFELVYSTIPGTRYTVYQ